MKLRSIIVMASVLLAGHGLAGGEIVVWNSGAGPTRAGREAALRAFESANPGFKVKSLSLSAGGVDPQKLFTAILGGVPPDVVYQDRFLIASWASRGAFLPLDAWMRSSRFDASALVPASLAECRWGGRTYGIPVSSDTRALYWNKALFRRAGLDPDRPPRTWSELLQCSRALGRLPGVVGFDPLHGAATPYLYVLQAGEKGVAFALECYEASGGFKTVQQALLASGPEAQSAFASGKVAMQIDGDWSLSELKRLAPELDFGCAPPPVPDGSPQAARTWSGGNAMVVPRGARNADGAWRLIAFMTSREGSMIQQREAARWAADRRLEYVPPLSSRIEDSIATGSNRFLQAREVHRKLLADAPTRPVDPDANQHWSTLLRASAEFIEGRGELRLDALSPYIEPPDTRLSERVGASLSEDMPWIISACVVGVMVLVACVGFYLRRKRSDGWIAICFLAPTLIGLIGWTLIPAIQSLVTSFTMSDGLSQGRWAGLENYSSVARADAGGFWRLAFNAFYLAGIGIPLAIATGLSLALLLRQSRPGWRALVFSPSIVPPVVSTLLWFWILQPDSATGALNWVWVRTITPALGYAPPDWLGSASWSKDALIIMSLWGAGGGILVWLAALRRVPASLRDATRIDGASPWRAFQSVTWPAISPIVFLGLVAGLVGALQEFDRPYLFHRDDGLAGPADSLATPAYQVFRLGFMEFKFGSAAAAAWMLAALILAVLALQFASARFWVRPVADGPT